MADIIERNATCARQLLEAAAEIERLRAGIGQIILKFEAGENHNDGAFDPECETCRILHDLRSLQQLRDTEK